MIDIAKLLKLSNGGNIYVAVSGGEDSICLLHSVHSLPNVQAIHVNHNISPNSKKWEDFCIEFCNKLQISLNVENVKLSSYCNLEETARNLRYEIFESYLEQENDILLMAHHLDDLAETVLLNLFSRGSGVTGLAGIPEIRKLGNGILYRPLLSVYSQEINTYATKHKLSWVEDDSNSNTIFDRNFIRHEVMPMLKNRWQAATINIAKSAQLCRQASEKISEQSYIDLLDCLIGEGKILNINSLKKHSSFQQANILRFWIKSLFNLNYPSKDKMDNILELINFDSEKNTKMLVYISNKLVIRRHKHFIFAVATFKYDASNLETYLLTEFTTSFNFGRLSVKSEMKGSMVNAEYHVKFRPTIGNKNYIFLNGKYIKLKKILQEEGIPYWLKDYIPLIYSTDNELVAIAIPDKMIISDNHKNQKNELGYEIKWEFN